MSLLVTFWKHLGRRIEQTGKTAGQMKSTLQKLQDRQEEIAKDQRKFWAKEVPLKAFWEKG